MTFTNISKLLITALLINFAVIPFVSFFIGSNLFDNTGYLLAFIVMGSLPTSGMTISWTDFAKGSVKDAVKITILGLLIGSMLIPVYIKLFLGTAVSISIFSILRQVVLIIIVPLILGNLTRRILIKKAGKESYEKDWKKKLPLLSSFGLVLIIFISMGLKAKSILNNPSQVLGIIFPVVALYVASFIISTLIGKLFFCRKGSVALVYGTALRNLSIAMGISVSLFSEYASSIVLVLSIAYIIQVQASAWFLKLNEKILSNGALITKTKCKNKLKSLSEGTSY